MNPASWPGRKEGKDTMTTATAAKTTGRGISAAEAALFTGSYGRLVKWGKGSVRTAWEFGQTCDFFLGKQYTVATLAGLISKHPSTIYRYLKFFGAYQTPELAEEASEKLGDVFNIDILYAAATGGELPVSEHRSLKGRHFRYRCGCGCGSTEVKREEYDPDTGETIEPGTIAADEIAARREEAAAVEAKAPAKASPARKTPAKPKAGAVRKVPPVKLVSVQ